MASPTGGGVPFWRNFKLEFGNVATPYSDNATQDGNQLTNPGSGQRIGDQRNLLTRTVANFQTNVPAVPSFSIPTGSTSPVSVSISVPAWTLNGGSYTVNYSASSTSISLVRGIPSNVYFFMDDPDQTGGAKTLVASTNPDDAYANDGRIYIGAKKITVPSSGSSSGSGGGGGTGRPPNDPV